MLKFRSCIVSAGFVSLALSGAAQAAASTEGEVTATQGVVRCSFSTFLRQSNTEIHQAFITLRNVDPTEPIFIDRMRLWNARGIVLFDSALSGALPPTTGGATLGGPGNNTLSPNQSAQYEAAPIVGLIAAQGDRPGQVEIQWSAGRRGALTLQASTSRVVREHIPNLADPTQVGSIRAERSRSSSSCRSIALR